MLFIALIIKTLTKQRMKNLLLFLLIPFISQAQIVNGIVKDKNSKEGISFLTVAIENSDVYALTNENGEFQFNLSDINGKNIIIDNIYFEPFSKKINDGNYINIELTELSYTLEEMVLYNQPIKKVFEEIISNSEKTLKTNVKINAFYREDYFKNGKKYFFSDGIIDFYIKNKTSKIDAVILQSRVIDSNSIQQLNEIDLEYAAGLSPDEMIEMGMKFNFIKKIIKDKNYDFHVTSKKSGDNELHTLYFEPLPTSTERFLFKGKVVFDDSAKLIYEMDVQFDDNFKQFNKEINILILKIKMNDINYKVKFNYNNNKYYLTYLNQYFDCDVITKKGKNTEKVIGKTELIALGIENTSTFPNKDSIFKKKKLYENGNKFSYEFWNDDLIKNYIK